MNPIELNELVNAKQTAFSGQEADAQAQQEAQAKKDAEQKAQEQRQMMLKVVLTPEASERIKRVGLVRPERQRAVEDMVLNHVAQNNMGGGKITEANVLDILQKIEAQVQQNQPKIEFRRAFDDDSDEFDISQFE